MNKENFKRLENVRKSEKNIYIVIISTRTFLPSTTLWNSLLNFMYLQTFSFSILLKLF